MDKNTKQKRDQHIVKTSKEPLYHTNSKEKEKKKNLLKKYDNQRTTEKALFSPWGSQK